MVQQDSGPGKGGYVIGALLIIVGIVGGIAWGVVNGLAFTDAIDDFEREPVGQEVGTMELEAGEMVVYGERGGGGDNGITAVLGNVRMRPADEGADELELERYEAEFSYDIGNRAGRAQFTVDIPEDGEYQIRADGITGGATTVAVGPSVAGKLVSAIVGGLAIAGIGVVVGIIFLIVTGSRRRKFRQRGWTAGWNPPGTTPPGTWNPPGGGAGFGAPPQQGWNPPPPPSGGGFPPPPG
jgi:hypothetical protein